MKLSDLINVVLSSAVFLGVMINETKQIRGKEWLTRSAPHLQRHFRNHLRHWRRWSFRIAFLLSLAANIVQIWGPPWPTDPVFFAGPYSFGAPLDALFIVQNRSVFFPIRHPQFFCNPVSVHTEDGRLNLSGENFFMGTGAKDIDIGRDSTAPVRCVLSQIRFPGTKLKDAKVRLWIEYDFSDAL